MSKTPPEVEDLQNGRHPEKGVPPQGPQMNEGPLTGNTGIDPEIRPDTLTQDGDRADRSRGSGGRRSQH